MRNSRSHVELCYAPRPLPDETLLSWLDRLDEENLHIETSIIDFLLGTDVWHSANELTRACPQHVVTALSAATDLDESVIKKTLCDNPRQIVSTRLAFFCEACWRDDSAKTRPILYGRKEWTDAFTFVCPRHKSLILDGDSHMTGHKFFLSFDNRPPYSSLSNSQYLKAIEFYYRLEIMLKSLEAGPDGYPFCFEPIDDILEAIICNFDPSAGYSGASSFQFEFSHDNRWRHCYPPFFAWDDKIFQVYKYGPKPATNFRDLTRGIDRRFFILAALLTLAYWFEPSHPYQNLFPKAAWAWLRGAARSWPSKHIRELDPLLQHCKKFYSSD